MWNVSPKKMCRQHLLGEHLEMHMLATTIKQGKSIIGYVHNGLVEPHNIKLRHDALVREMLMRGYQHKTPMEAFEVERQGYVDVEANEVLLQERCNACKQRMM